MSNISFMSFSDNLDPHKMAAVKPWSDVWKNVSTRSTFKYAF